MVGDSFVSHLSVKRIPEVLKGTVQSKVQKVNIKRKNID